MKRLNAWFDRAPIGYFFATVTVIWIVLQVVFSLVDGDFSVARLVGYLVGGVVFGAIMTALLAFRRRRGGGVTTFAAINRSLRSGELPADADPAIWQPELARRERSLRMNRWLAPVVFGLFMVLSVVLAVTGASVVLGIVCFVLFAAVLVLSLVQGKRGLVKVHGLQNRIGAVGDYHPTPTY